MAIRTQQDYYRESKRLRAEVMLLADSLKGNPFRFILTNVITMRVEITKADLKTIVSKNVSDDKFNAIKNALAKDIPGYLAKAEYLGWRPTAEGSILRVLSLLISVANLVARPFFVCAGWPMAIFSSLMPL